jgi:hypothetical protein
MKKKLKEKKYDTPTVPPRRHLLICRRGNRMFCIQRLGERVVLLIISFDKLECDVFKMRRSGESY